MSGAGKAVPKVIVLPTVKEVGSRGEWEEACWAKLLQSHEWLACIITPYERRNIVMRAAVVHRLHMGKSYRAIGDELWLSPQTISAIKKGIRETRYRSYAERGKTERKKRAYSIDAPRRSMGMRAERVRTVFVRHARS